MEDDLDFDPCEECRLSGNDWHYDRYGAVIINCYHCPNDEYGWMRLDEEYE